jgi:membrane associated rhomboid family serine protease
MIPLRDTIPSRSFPMVTVTLIVANVLVFLYEFGLGPDPDRFLLTHGFVPAVYFHQARVHPWDLSARFAPIVSSMFLHGDWFHLISNMWVLWIFGDNVEDRLGKGRYVLYYLGCGLVAAYVHYLTGPHSGVPVIGASGAIAGVMGGFCILFPHAQIVALLPIFVFLRIVTIPAVLFLAFWFFTQLLNGMAASAAHFGGGVAWWAHVGGFVAGAFMVLPLRRAA